MKNKKGFTLIELLVTIALMLSILGIAIVSFINVSNKKKEESWQKVQNEAELAAEEYFNTNGYLLEGDKNATISIGKLVEESYLNVVTNPVTGKKVNNCDYVDVTYSKNGYSYKYIENENNVCPSNNFMSTGYVGAPKIDISLSGQMGKNNWYIGDVTAKATVLPSGKEKIISVKYCTGVSDCNNYTDLLPTSNNKYNVINYKISANKGGIDGEKIVTKFIATNSANKTVTGFVTYKKDTENPVCASNNGSTTWIKDKRTITQKCTDKTSGCTKDSYSVTFSKTTKLGQIDIADNAGNINQCNANVYVDNTKPSCGSNNGSTTWTNKDRNITQNCSDNESGCSSVTKLYNYTKKTDAITIKDKVGNQNTCNVNVYVDKGTPKFTVGLYKITTSNSSSTSTKYENNTWYNKYVYTNVNITNQTTSGIKSTTYTTTGATTNETNKSGGTRRVLAEGISYITYKVCNNAGTCATSNKYTIKLDRTPPVITYLAGPTKKSCRGNDGVYIKYNVSDDLSGIEEVYHYYGQDSGVKTYEAIKKYNIKININNIYKDTVERTWAVGNPTGCASENPQGPNTNWCYYNNTAVKDKAGNTATGISSSCSKVGK